MKIKILIVFTFLILISWSKNPIKSFNEEDRFITDTVQVDSLSILWNKMVFQEGGCLGGQQYVQKVMFKRSTMVFSEKTWDNFSKKNKYKLTEFLLTKLSDTTKTKIHTCPFFTATNGEMAVYCLQHIHNVNWYDFTEFKEYKDREYKSAVDQPQMWLRDILDNERKRALLENLFKSKLKK